ncbi:TonB-dependent receptor [Acidipila sp. EB88]|uniref:TonB-dependent receptor n=1 Tax=Acidipila sp. EB88 TaxID=2305226 RepID=UPI0013158E40|nr:TonB-dependent receptor [Acidipila sp. EB88]
MIEPLESRLASSRNQLAPSRAFGLRATSLALAACGALTFLPSSCVLAQSTVGNITGRIVAQDGTLVQDAQVTVINEGTHATRSLHSNADGNYGASELNPGTYTVLVEAPGYASFKNLDVVLASQQTVRIDVTLKVGQVDASVQVTEGAPVIQTEMPSIASTVSALTLANTSSNLLSTSDATGDSGLLFYTELLPGGEKTGDAFNWSVYGSRGAEAYYSVDGISSNSVLYGNMVGPSLPPFGMVQEVQYSSVNNKAELGQLLNVSVITKSGANKFHGDAYDNYANSALNARNYFANTVGRNIQDDFGADLGGAILKDKLFFFASGEFLRQTSPAVINPSVPTAAFRSGDFSSLLTGANPIQLKNPLTGANYAGNIIPVQQLNAGALAWQNAFYPLPNFGLADNYVANFRGTYPQKTYTNRYYLRGDYNFSPSNTMYARMGYVRSSPEVLDSGLPPSLTGLRVQKRHTWQGVISDTWVLSPSLINVATVGLTHTENDFGGDIHGQALIDTLGITGLPTAPAEATGIPSFYLNNFTSPYQLPQSEPTEQTVQFIDQVTYQKASHTMKIGIEYRPMQAEQYFNYNFGTESFTGGLSGFDYADFLLGLPQTTGYTYTRPPQYSRLWYLSGYAQDDYRIRKNLTLFYGLRYDYNSPAVDKNNVVASFDPASGAIVVPNASIAQNYINPAFPSQIPIETAAQAGFPSRSFREATKLAIYPRVGFSWQPFNNGNTVVRGGYGIFNEEFTAGLASYLYGGPFGISVGYTNTIANGAPSVSLQQPINTNEGGIGLGAVSVSAPKVNLSNPYIQQFNLTVEQNLGFKTGLRLSYVSTRAAQLTYTRNIDQPVAGTAPYNPATIPYPDYYSVYQFDNGGYENYNAFTAEINHPFAHGISFEGAITWAKNLTDDDDQGGNGIEGGVTAEDSYNLSREKGNAQYDPRIAFVSNLIYQLPVGRGGYLLKGDNIAARLAGGWKVSGAYLAQSGHFLTPMYSGTDQANVNQFSGSVDKTGISSVPVNGRNITTWYNPAAYTTPQSGNFGHAGYGIVEGPNMNTVNLALFKSFPLFRESQLELRGSFTNVLNHTNFGDPNMTITDTGAGQITSVTTNTFGQPRAGLITATISF